VSAPKKASSGSSPPAGKNAYRIPEGSGWANAWKTAAAVGALGLAGSAAGYFTNPERFAFSYLFAFFLFLTFALGAIFFILVERLTSAGWSITVRRTAEFFAVGSPVFLVLFIPLLACMGTLYPWLGEKHHDAVATAHAAEPDSPTTGPNAHLHDNPHAAAQPTGAAGTHDPMPESHAAGVSGAAHGGHGEHGAAAAHGGGHHGDPEEVAEEELMEHKRPWLNKTGFIVRAVLYFLVWAWIGTAFFGFSTKQDTTKDPKFTVQAQRLAPAATFLFGFTLTGAAFDWLMSLLPSWYSTIFGVTIFAGSVVAMYATMIIVTMSLNKAGHLKNAVNTEHYHDLGKLLFGFNVFWAYTSFAQFMLIWYAAIPEEVTFYHHRWGAWKTVSMAIVFCHFVIPFFILLSRNTKRKLGVLQFGAAWMLVMHAVEMYWFVMPYYAGGESSVHWLDVTCFLGIGGVYLAVVMNRMTKHPLIPIGDPRLSRSLTFENA
jgi:hypothetical protein